MTRTNNIIKKYRDSLNLSQTRFGKRIGYACSTVSAWECDRAKPPLKIINEASKYLNSKGGDN